MMYDYLFEFIDEGIQFFVEETSLENAWATLCDTWGFDRKNLEYIEKYTVEEGEMLGLDTY